jgi:hypothetical protein
VRERETERQRETEGDRVTERERGRQRERDRDRERGRQTDRERSIVEEGERVTVSDLLYPHPIVFEWTLSLVCRTGQSTSLRTIIQDRYSDR